jgi:MOSC domain-containing protein YiiM
VLSVNVGGVRQIEWRGRTVATGIWKYPAGAARVMLRGVNLDGDDQGDRVSHGGRDKAVYAYAAEDYEYWSEREGMTTTPGLFGENLTVQGLSLRDSLVGERWRIGTAELEVIQPRLPCYKLGIRVRDAAFPQRFQVAGRLGAYLRIVTEGDVGAGDSISVMRSVDHSVTLGLMADALRDRGKAGALLDAPYLPTFWRRVANGESVD